MPELRAALADYLTGPHARPVAEERIQITASGMAAVAVALAATVRAGERVVLHARPGPTSATRRGCAARWWTNWHSIRMPEGRFRLDLDRLDAMLRGARAFILNSPNNPTGWTATRDELAAILDIMPPPRRLADLGRGVFAAGL